MIRDSIVEFLGEQGYDAIGAADGRDALDKLDGSSPRPCLILLDLMMPVMDGQTFRAEQRADSTIAEIPVVVISAYRDLDKYRDELATECLPKPVRLDTLLQTARKHCDAEA